MSGDQDKPPFPCPVIYDTKDFTFYVRADDKAKAALEHLSKSSDKSSYDYKVLVRNERAGNAEAQAVLEYYGKSSDKKSYDDRLLIQHEKTEVEGGALVCRCFGGLYWSVTIRKDATNPCTKNFEYLGQNGESIAVFN